MSYEVLTAPDGEEADRAKMQEMIKKSDPAGTVYAEINPPQLNLQSVKRQLEKMGLLVKRDELPDDEGATPD